MMKNNRLFLYCILIIISQVLPGKTISIQGPEGNVMLEFAIRDLSVALQKSGNTVTDDGRFHIVFESFMPGMGPQSFRIQKEGNRGIRIFGGDTLGLMYGGLELAEMIELGGGLDAVEEKARKPYVLRRGLKFNIPFDGRTPSYDDTGDAAQNNIITMWDFNFWRDFLDTMVRNRYNVLTLWTTHPYSGIVRLPKYPDVNFDDVGRVTREITPQTHNHFTEYDLFDPANYQVIKTITLDEKITYWTKVFDYAEALGIEIYMFHWNIFLWNAVGKYGITYDQDNTETIAYVRYAIAEFLKTYPQIDGIGVSAGEHVNRKKAWKIGIEDWLYETYGLGMLDALEADPDRKLRFIFRHLWSDLSKSAAAFEGYDVPFNTSHKYARARLYSTTTSPYLDLEYRDKVEATNTPCWLNLRNDDLFLHRWGNPDYAREFLLNMPHDLMRNEAGFYMGSDSYVWGREFTSKDPGLAGQWEIEKHWFRFMIWGRLGYDVSLQRNYFEARLAKHFQNTDPSLLYDTWAASSKVISWIDRFFFRVNDVQFAPEGCMNKGGFLTVDASFFRHPPLRGSGMLSVQEYASAVVNGEPFTGMTPIEVADQLDRLSEQTLAGMAELKASDKTNKELQATLTDMESMVALGRYYANKIRGAAELAIYRMDKNRKSNHQNAVACLSDAVADWEEYARIASSQSRTQLLSRTNDLDWYRLLEDVKHEVMTIRQEE